MPGSKPERSAWAGRALALGVAFVSLSLLWNLPVASAGIVWPALRAASLEVTVMFLLLALVPALRRGRSGLLVAVAMALATSLVVTLMAAELVMRETLARPLNPLLDVYLAKSLVHLLTGTLSGLLGWLALAGLALVPPLVGIGAFALARTTQRTLDRRWARRAIVAIGGALIALFALQEIAPQALGHRQVMLNHASVTLLRQWRVAKETAAGLEALEVAIAQDRFRRLPSERLLGRLHGADVLLIFVESYGRSALEQARYAERLLPTLAAFDQRLAERDLHAASAWLTSPTVGGQSWLAHGTLESG
ncbi:MAG TPA: hypothetical protein VE592_03860, partial [Geminicoccaceae bacterium]|nr:hypothetical protein [Geminicoccaceae bacterium]